MRDEELELTKRRRDVQMDGFCEPIGNENRRGASVLVNGSPTEKFPIQRGLRQGILWPLSCLSLLRKDSTLLLTTLSGMEKSSIIGVGVQENEVSRMALSFGCKPEKLSFKYLGIPVGGSSARINMWDPIVVKFHKRLSNWKGNLLSIGGRTTLIISVLGSLGLYFLSLYRMPKEVNNNLEAMRSKFFWGGSKNQKKIAWVKWNTVLAAKEDGGLEIGSLEAMNQALLYRWRWRALIIQPSKSLGSDY
uniref:uncharacterized protein LOC122609238 n=1 Tax=Erigeron canadensis TaxID=72917 RepID=UPI001CB9CDD2|nr:uncharacterized protein LOC122609238 [Erigeron canadensis]